MNRMPRAIGVAVIVFACLVSTVPASHYSCEIGAAFGDANYDGRTRDHCGTDFQLERFTAGLVQGYIINPNGTYTLFGDPGFDQPDGILDDFFEFTEGENSLCAGGPDHGATCLQDSDSSTDCGSPPQYETGLCEDGEANDCDGFVDCDDPNCITACCGNGACDPHDGYCCGDCVSLPPTEENCNDGIDLDCDGTLSS